MTPDTSSLHEIFHASPIGIALENLDGQPFFVNPAFCAFLGFSEEELRNKHCVDFSPAEDAEKDWALFQELRAGLRDHYQLEKRYIRRDGSLVWGSLSISLVSAHPSPLILAMVQDITAKKTAEEALSEMTGKLIEAQEQDRARIARELHDDINQRLAILGFGLDQLKNNPSEIENQVRELRKQTTELSSDVESISHDLHSGNLEYLGVVAGIESWCREFGKRQETQIDYRHDVRTRVNSEVGLCLFRVLQEALHNAVKHSGVKRVEVQLRDELGEIHLIVSDQGKGFNAQAERQGKGLGLISMRERVRLVNGKITIDSKPMSGTTVHVRVPLNP